MPFSVLVVAGTVVLVTLVVRVIYRFMVFHAERLITCPENRRPAGIRLHAWQPAVALGDPEFEIAACTRWPDRSGCGQECLRQVEGAPRDCEVRRILAHWYRGKPCANCGIVFEDILREVPKPALLTADKESVDWEQIPVEKLPEVLEQSKPICFACHTAGALVREHPELVVERPSQPIGGGPRSSKT